MVLRPGSDSLAKLNTHPDLVAVLGEDAIVHYYKNRIEKIRSGDVMVDDFPLDEIGLNAVVSEYEKMVGGIIENSEKLRRGENV